MTEDEHHMALVEYANLYWWGELFVHNENEMPLYNLAKKVNPYMLSNIMKKRVRKGVRKGFPDFMLYVPRETYPGLALEIKPSGSMKATLEQKHYLEILRQQGYQTHLSNDLDLSIQYLNDYLSLEKKV